MAKQQEIRSLTGLRGAASILVVFHHYTSPIGTSNFVARVISHGYLAVDIFFVLSGFVMALTYAHMFETPGLRGAYFTFLGRRVARVYPLYAIAILCAAVLAHAGWLEYEGGKMTLDLLLDLGMIQVWFSRPSIDPPGWTISAEWTVYLLFPWLLSLCLPARRWLAWSTLTAAIALTVYAVTTPHEVALAGSVAILQCIGEFTLGLFTYRMLSVPWVSALKDIPWLEPVAAGLLLLSLGFKHGNLATVFLSPVVIFLLSSDQGPVSRLLGTRILHRLGVLSFSIYIIHYLLQGLMVRIHAYAVGHKIAHAQFYAIVVALPITYLLAHLACRWIEIPGRRFVRHILEGEKKPFAEIAAR